MTNSPRTFDDLQADSGVPTRYAACSFESFTTSTPAQDRVLGLARRCAQAVIDTPKAGASLVLYGSPGAGKTHLACAIANEVMRAGRRAAFGSALGAIRHIKSTYRRDSVRTEDEAIEDLLAPDLLILDEIGVQVGSEHEKMLLFDIINERYQWCSSTILISNLDRDELVDYLGHRMMDRFAETGAVLAFDWPSFRGKARG